MDARYQLGLAYARANRQAEASRELVAVIQDDPTRADVLNDLGVSYLFQERYHEALLALQGALTARPGFPEAHANLGRLYTNTRMPHSAVRELETAAAGAPRRPDILTDLGFAYLATMNFRSAEAAYQKAIQLSPKDATAHTGLGRAYYGLARYAEAEAALSEALKLDPNAPVALLVMAQVRLDQGSSDQDVEVAHTLLLKSVQADPSDPDAWYELGRATLKRDQPEEAVKHFQRALAIAGDHGGSSYQLSRALRRLGRVKEADQVSDAFRKGVLRTREVGRIEERLQANPNDIDLKIRLVHLYLESGKTGLATLIFRQLKDSAPSHPGLAAIQARLSRQTSGDAQGSKGARPN
jgi:Flp pilus assembly protein TadD